MSAFPLKNPSPDFETFEKVLKGEKIPEKVYFVELVIDMEIIEFISETMMGTRIPSFQDIWEEKAGQFFAGEKIVLLSQPEEKLLWKHYINFYYRMGYDYVPDIQMWYLRLLLPGSALPLQRQTLDTAILSRGKRAWLEEKKGVITCWEDFEKFPWEAMNNVEVEEYYRFLDENLPEGMKITAQEALYQWVQDRFFGPENMFYLISDDPRLVKAVIDKMGEAIYEFYKSVIPLECIGAIFHSDDLGFKTATTLRPDLLREFIFPWYKKYASLAHEYGKTYWYHCCGYKDEIMEDFINDVKIDALHSFEDVCCPVTEFKRRYGDKIALLGGVDVDKLARLDEENLRKYVRGILNKCMVGGRYALGSGNSVTNYVPVKNYLAMLDEGLKWR